jgi:hypothetical protein
MGTIIFLSLSLINLSIMLIIDVTFNIDINNCKIEIFVKLYKIKFIVIKINLLTLTYSINNGKTRRLKLILRKGDKYLLEQIKSNILNKLYYDSVSLYVVLNLVNPKLTADTMGMMYIFLNVANYYLLNKNEDMDISYKLSPDFDKLNNKIKLDLRVYFTIFDMVYAIVLSFYKRGKYVKEKR